MFSSASASTEVHFLTSSKKFECSATATGFVKNISKEDNIDLIKESLSDIENYDV